jgi:hypothetical protein
MLSEAGKSLLTECHTNCAVSSLYDIPCVWALGTRPGFCLGVHAQHQMLLCLPVRGSKHL